MEDMITYLNRFDEFITYNNKMAEAIGDCPNLEIRVNSDNPFWKTVKSIGNWKCQRNLISDRARIVSPDEIRVGNGSETVMLEKMKRLASGKFIQKGDVLGVSRSSLYEHYAVYIGNGKVIHYCGENNDFTGRVTIHEAPMKEFLKGAKNFFIVWFDNGRPVKIQKSTSFIFNSSLDFYNGTYQRKRRKVLSADETIRRARSRIGEENYNLVANNCEHFAMWCKTGIAESSQIKQILNYAVNPGVTGYGNK